MGTNIRQSALAQVKLAFFAVIFRFLKMFLGTFLERNKILDGFFRRFF